MPTQGPPPPSFLQLQPTVLVNKIQHLAQVVALVVLLQGCECTQPGVGYGVRRADLEGVQGINMRVLLVPVNHQELVQQPAPGPRQPQHTI